MYSLSFFKIFQMIKKFHSKKEGRFLFMCILCDWTYNQDHKINLEIFFKCVGYNSR